MPEENNILSEREDQILQLVAKGMTNREIAQFLTISPNTVKVHLSNVFEKLGVSSRTEATLYGIEHGIVSVPGNERTENPETPAEQPFFRKYRWVLIPVAGLLLAAILLMVFGRDLIFPQPTPTPSGAEVIAEMQDRWQELAPMPAARTGLAATAYDGNIYAIAGEGPAGVSRSVFRYVMEDDRWESLEDKPTPVQDVEAALIGEKIYVPGGLLGDGAPTNILEIYDPRANQWESGAPLPVKLSAYAMADFEGQLYLFGGWDGQKALDNVFIYDPGTDEWREGTPMATARYQAEAIPLADKIVVVGGRDNQVILKNADYFYPSRDLREETPWEALSPLPEPLTGISVINVYDTLYVIGGYNPDGGSQAASYIFYDDVWSEFGDIQPQVMQSPTLTNVGSFIYLLNPGESSDQTAFWSYKAFSYEIFLPIIQ